MERVIIKLLNNPENPDLKMKYIGAKEYCTPKVGPDGKVITGLDENALYILRMEDNKIKTELQKNIKKERESLERLLGVDLTPGSTYWNDYYIILDDEEVDLDFSNPLDRVREKFLVANGYVAPSFEDIENDEKYHNTIFYLYREAEESSKSIQKTKQEDRAKYELFNMYEQNSAKLAIVAQYLLGHALNADVKPDTAYTKLRDYIETTDKNKKKINLASFLAAIEKSPEQMATKIILDKAIKKRIVAARGGIHRRGEVILGNSYDEALDYLLSVENSGELNSLNKEVEKIK